MPVVPRKFTTTKSWSMLLQQGDPGAPRNPLRPLTETYVERVLRRAMVGYAESERTDSLARRFSFAPLGRGLAEPQEILARSSPWLVRMARVHCAGMDPQSAKRFGADGFAPEKTVPEREGPQRPPLENRRGSFEPSFRWPGRLNGEDRAVFILRVFWKAMKPERGRRGLRRFRCPRQEDEISRAERRFRRILPEYPALLERLDASKTTMKDDRALSIGMSCARRRSAAFERKHRPGNRKWCEKGARPIPASRPRAGPPPPEKASRGPALLGRSGGSRGEASCSGPSAFCAIGRQAAGSAFDHRERSRVPARVGGAAFPRRGPVSLPVSLLGRATFVSMAVFDAGTCDRERALEGSTRRARGRDRSASRWSTAMPLGWHVHCRTLHGSRDRHQVRTFAGVLESKRFALELHEGSVTVLGPSLRADRATGFLPAKACVSRFAEKPRGFPSGPAPGCDGGENPRELLLPREGGYESSCERGPTDAPRGSWRQLAQGGRYGGPRWPRPKAEGFDAACPSGFGPPTLLLLGRQAARFAGSPKTRGGKPFNWFAARVGRERTRPPMSAFTLGRIAYDERRNYREAGALVSKLSGVKSRWEGLGGAKPPDV